MENKQNKQKREPITNKGYTSIISTTNSQTFKQN